MKKLGILMAAAMLFVGASAFAANAPKTVKQGVKKEASASKKTTAHKSSLKKHHAAKSKAKSTAAPKAK